jgi:hypothetical protein
MRRVIGIAIIAAACVAAYVQYRVVVPTPAPVDNDIPLKGLFIGPTAGEDALLMAALCNEVAAEIEWDGMQDDPVLNTGIQYDLLRVRARNLFLRGDSIGERQPHVADAVGEYLTNKLGVSGGPVTPEQRAKWVTAYRELARSAEYAAR